MLSSTENVVDFQTGSVAAGIDLGKAIARSGIAAFARHEMDEYDDVEVQTPVVADAPAVQSVAVQAPTEAQGPVEQDVALQAPPSLSKYYNTDVDLLLAVSDVALQYMTVNEKVVLWAMNMVTGKAEPGMTIVIEAWYDGGGQVLFFVPYHFFFCIPCCLLLCLVFVLCRCMAPSPSYL
jgi:hypothetical protein